MSKLSLELSPDSGPVSIAVLDDDLSVKESLFLVGPDVTEVNVDVAPGRYTLRVRRPSGAGYDKQVEVGPSGQSVVIGDTSSPHEWLLDIARLGELPAIPPSTGTLLARTLRGSEIPPLPARQVVLCLHWRSADGTWVFPKLPKIHRRLAPDFFRIFLEAPFQGAAAVELREAGHPSLFILYPGSLNGITLIGRPDLTSSSIRSPSRMARADWPGETPITPPIALRVISDDPTFQGLLQFLSSRSPEDTEAMVARWRIDGEEEWSDIASIPRDEDSYSAHIYMKEKFSSPAKAAAGGLFLLRFGQVEMLRDWPRNLADYFPWLPDGPVIEGWRRLMAPSNKSNPPYPEWRGRNPPPPGSIGDHPAAPNAPRPDDPLIDAALRFIEAETRGVPVFVEGLRALDAGLRYCYRALDEGDLRDRLSQSIQKISPFLRFGVDVGPFTAFLGQSCEQAGLKPAIEKRRPPTSDFFSFEVTQAGFRAVHNFLE